MQIKKRPLNGALTEKRLEAFAKCIIDANFKNREAKKLLELCMRKGAQSGGRRRRGKGIILERGSFPPAWKGEEMCHFKRIFMARRDIYSSQRCLGAF